MKNVSKTVLFASLLLYLGFGTASANGSPTDDMIRFGSCRPEHLDGLSCVRYTVHRGDTLSKIAHRYSNNSNYRPITARELLAIPGNGYLKNRQIPEGLKGYSGPGWNRTAADWIFEGDTVVLPFVWVKDIADRSFKKKALHVANEQKEKLALAQTELKQANDRADLFNILGAIFFLGIVLAFFVAFWRTPTPAPEPNDEKTE